MKVINTYLMKICAAQTRPVKGNIQANIENHKRLIDLAIFNGADLIIFPELSLTGYEPTLAKDLAIEETDCRLDEFQNISDTKNVIVGVGVPTKTYAGICISMIIFQPQKRIAYSKKYIHSDEEEFFISGNNFASFKFNNINLSIAICYELSIPEHAENAFKNGGQIYFASVAKSASGVENASHRLSEIANKYSMTVLMCNSVGECDNFECAGRTAAWNNKGILLSQLNGTSEGILIFDTETDETKIYYHEKS